MIKSTSPLLAFRHRPLVPTRFLRLRPSAFASLLKELTSVPVMQARLGYST